MVVFAFGADTPEPMPPGREAGGSRDLHGDCTDRGSRHRRDDANATNETVTTHPTPTIDRAPRRRDLVDDAGRDRSLAWPDPTLPAAQRLELSWWDQSPERGDQGPLDSAIGTHLLTAEDPMTGERAGYLKISHTNDALCAAAYPTLLHFVARNSGWYIDTTNPGRAWKQAHHYAQRCPASITAAGRHVRAGALTDTDIPDPATIAADLDILIADRADQYREWRECFAVPYVAYSEVACARGTRPGFGRRQGIGMSLYLAAAKHLGTQGRVLRASGIQSDAAAHLWEHLRRVAGDHMTAVTVTYHGQTRTYAALDYRP